MKMLKLIPKAIVAPIYAALFLIYIIGSGVAALSSMVTSLLGNFFLIGAVAGWIAHGNEATIWTVTGMGIFFLLAPLILKGVLEIVMRCLACCWGFSPGKPTQYAFTPLRFEAVFF